MYPNHILNVIELVQNPFLMFFSGKIYVNKSSTVMVFTADSFSKKTHFPFFLMMKTDNHSGDPHERK